ncbi:MAG: FadR/GntR family transcriptional regulator [Pseudomonadota bacterium]
MTLPWEQSGQIAYPISKSVKLLATQLFDRISKDDYPFGTRLPAERQLAEEFSVSRNTVRQALEFLESHEIVARRAGSGSFVTFKETVAPPTPASDGSEIAAAIKLDEIAENTSPLELNIVRSIIEPEMVRLAVINMRARDIVRLKDCLDALQKVKTSVEEFSKWDRKFHLEIARGTHNPLLIGLYELIDQVRRDAQWATNQEKTFSPKRIREYQSKHRAIYEAIEARDIESAVEFSKLHMTEVQRDLMQGL